MHDLDQGHLRDRVEEVQPDEPLGVSQLLGQRLENQARGVGRQQRGGFHSRLEPCVQTALGLETLEDGLDHHISAVDTGSFHVGGKPLAGRRTLRGIPESLGKQLSGSLQSGLDELLSAVLQRHGEAAQSRPGRDVAAHDTGAHDVHVFDIGCSLAAERLQAILEEEDTHEIARGLGGEQMCDRTGLGLECRGATGAMTRPEIHDRKRSGIVFAACFAGYLCDESRLDRRAHQGPAEHLLDERRAMARRCSLDELTGSGAQLIGGDEPVNESDPQCLVRSNRLPRQHHVHRGPHAHEPDGAYGASKPGMNAELNFR